MAAALRPGSHEFEALLASVRARSASSGVDRTRRALLERLAVGPRDRVLELGVGSGRHLFAVAVRAGFAAGVDPDADALRHAGRRCERLVREGRVVLVEGTSRDLSAFAAESFDRVYGVLVTAFWEEPASHLAEVRRVLRPGGRVVFAASGGVERLALGLAGAGFRGTRVASEGALAWIESAREEDRT
jgi:ubiquinone/menaquinone biosynthesis C-methylase UbiE